jgi:Tfp pilus assembly protein PilF
MHILYRNPERLFLAFILCLFSAASTAEADKNNKFLFNVERYYGKGRVYFDQAVREWDKGNIPGARQALNGAVQADPKMWPAWFALAEIDMQ